MYREVTKYIGHLPVQEMDLHALVNSPLWMSAMHPDDSDQVLQCDGSWSEPLPFSDQLTLDVVAQGGLSLSEQVALDMQQGCDSPLPVEWNPDEGLGEEEEIGQEEDSLTQAVPAWQCEGVCRAVSKSAAKRWNKTLLLPSLPQSAGEVWDACPEVSSPLLTADLPSSESDVKMEPAEFSEPSSPALPQEEGCDLTYVWPDLDLKVEPVVLPQVEGCGSAKQIVLTRQCRVVLDRSEVDRYLAAHRTQGRTEERPKIVLKLKRKETKWCVRQREKKNPKKEPPEIPSTSLLNLQNLVTPPKNIFTNSDNENSRPSSQNSMKSSSKKTPEVTVFSSPEHLNRVLKQGGTLKTYSTRYNRDHNSDKCQVPLEASDNLKDQSDVSPHIGDHCYATDTKQGDSEFRFQCPNCCHHFAYETDAKRHCNEEHQGANLYRIKKMSMPVYKCELCPKTSFKMDAMKQHIQRFHSEIGKKRLKLLTQANKTFPCYYCSKQFKSVFRFKKHVFWAHALPSLQKNSLIEKTKQICVTCNQSFDTTVDLRLHKLEFHELKDITITKIKRETDVKIKTEPVDDVMTNIKVEKPDDELDIEQLLQVSAPQKSSKSHETKNFQLEFEKFIVSKPEPEALFDGPDLDESVDLIDLEEVKVEQQSEGKVKVEQQKEGKVKLEQQKADKAPNIQRNIPTNSAHDLLVKNADILTINGKILVAEPTLHPSDIDTTKYYTCNLCKFVTACGVELEKHSRLHVAQYNLNNVCVCGRVCSSVRLFTSHVNVKHHGDQSFKSGLQALKEKQTAFRCKFCCAIYTDSKLFYIHIFTHKRNVDCFYDCLHCHLEFGSSQQLVDHSIVSHQDFEPFKCRICYLGHSDLSSLSQHVNLNHAQNFVHCVSCKVDLPSELYVNNHHKVCRKDKFECPFCAKYRCRNVTSFSLHIRKQHFRDSVIDSNYFCNICMNFYSTEHNFQLHCHKHRLTQLQCHFCLSLHNGKMKLRRHLRTNHFPIQKLFPCLACDGMFSKKIQLRRHVFSVHKKLIAGFVFQPK